MRIHPVILCGGIGTRLWPASRASRPKQFIPLLGDASLFQGTVARVTAAGEGGRLLVVTGDSQVDHVVRQLRQMGAAGTVVAEPEGRDSGPAIAAAAALIAAEDPEGLLLVVASDHHIPDMGGFGAAVQTAAAAANLGRIVTFGVKPAAPATAYGYIEAGDAVAEAPGVFDVRRFVEKPDQATAAGYVSAGYLWNSGNFLFQAGAFLEELDRHAPEMTAAAREAVAQGEADGPVLRLGPAFRAAPKRSIDYALMEKTDRTAVAPVDYHWSDLGAWDAVWAVSDQDGAGNAARGDVLLLDSRNCLVRNEGSAPVAVVGLQSVAVVVEPDGVLVCDLASGQAVRQVADTLEARRAAQTQAAPPASLASRAEAITLWLRASALPLWWSLGADHRLGGFHEALDLDGRPVSAPRRLRVQARQVYAFATAARLGWPGPWADAARHGLDFLVQRYRRLDGLFRTLVSDDGMPAEETATLYDQAFVLLALAAAAAALPDRAAALRAEAEALLGRLQALRHRGGGYTESTGATPFQSNPHMHLLEATLAWSEAGGGKVWDQLADEVATLALDRFIDADRGVVRELFDADWRPAAGLDGRILEPGHQFEWAWLLQRWGTARGHADAQTMAQRMFEAGRRGVDPHRNVAMDALLDDFSVHRPTARLWPQTERLKAALILGREDEAATGLAGLQAYLKTPVPGLWRDRLGADGRFVEEPAPASSFYHLVCAIAELQGSIAPAG